MLPLSLSLFFYHPSPLCVCVNCLTTKAHKNLGGFVSSLAGLSIKWLKYTQQLVELALLTEVIVADSWRKQWNMLRLVEPINITNHLPFALATLGACVYRAEVRQI